jgi:hypothetical protein
VVGLEEVAVDKEVGEKVGGGDGGE